LTEEQNTLETIYSNLAIAKFTTWYTTKQSPFSTISQQNKK